MSPLKTRNPNLDIAQLAPHPQAGRDPWWGPRGDDWWTGCKPIPGACPGVDDDGILRSLPMPDLTRASRQDFLDYFENTWALTELLFSSLQGREAFLTPVYHQLRHPLIFYYAHPAALYVNKLLVAGLIAEGLDPLYEQVFETGVDEMSWDDMSKNQLEWPSIEEARDYRRRVHDLVRGLIEERPAFADDHAPITMKDPEWAIVMGFEHERIHIETSSVLLREMPVNQLRRPEAWPPLHPERGRPGAVLANPLIAVPAGAVELGKPAAWPSFGWDNEYGRQAREVPAFEASRFLITNGEFLDFVRAEGYREERFWTKDGWRWRRSRNVRWPTFWVADGPAGLHEYQLRTQFEVIDLPRSWPVDVNWYEARAYCAWRSERDRPKTPYRLLSEAEHVRLRAPALRPEGLRAAGQGDPVMALGSAAMAREAGFNLNLAYGSESPVDAHPANELGVHDSMGNLWQWCEDDFHPLEGFAVHPLYDDFSSPCFDGEHKMILGGSFISTGDEASVFSRFHFRPHFFQHAGFRIARSATPAPAVLLDKAEDQNPYESDDAFHEYMLLHYGAPEEQMPYGFGPKEATRFPQRVAAWLMEAADAAGAPKGAALDIGCSVGGSVFALAERYDRVIGLDYSQRFIDAAEAIRESGELSYRLKVEGERFERRIARRSAGIDPERLEFRRGDACALPADWVGFDAVLLSNLLCRLPSPRACLGRLGGPRGLVAPGGFLAISSPFTWGEQYTPRDAWLGARVIDGQEVASRDALIEALQGDFELIEEKPLPLVIREHSRKFQYIVAHGSLWRRKA